MSPLPRAFVIGAHRAGGLKLLPLLSPHLDVVGIAPATFLAKPFPSQLLETVLRSFHPPIQVLTLGGAFTDQDTQAATKVWEEYRKEVEAKEEDYGAESSAPVALVRTKGEEITAIKKELDIEGYEAVGKAIIRNLEKL